MIKLYQIFLSIISFSIIKDISSVKDGSPGFLMGKDEVMRDISIFPLVGS